MGDLQVQILFWSVLTWVLSYSILNANRSSSSSPPGPWKLPAIGNIHHLISLKPLHRLFAQLAERYAGEGGVLGLQIGQLPILIISSPVAAKEILTGDAFLDRLESLSVQIFSYNYTDLAFAPHGPHWRNLRQTCKDNLLCPNRVNTFRRIRETESAKFARSISESAGEVIDLSEKTFALVIGITFQAAFGGGGENREILGEFVAAIQSASVLSGRLDVCDLFPVWPFSWYRSAMRTAHQRLDRILDVILRNARVADGDCLSLVDVLLSHDSMQMEPQSHMQIKAVILDVFMAGTETSSTTIEWAMSELVRNPEIMQRTQSEIREVVGNKDNVEEDDIEKLPFLDSIVKETLRLHPPTPLIPRQASKDTEILGRYQIPCKTRVLINAWAIGRDPQHWADPEEFKPERFGVVEVDYKGKNNNYSFIPFGAGKRACPGKWFGKANVMLPLAQLLFHFDWKLPGGKNPRDLNMDEGNGATIGRKNHLRLVAIKYRN